MRRGGGGGGGGDMLTEEVMISCCGITFFSPCLQFDKDLINFNGRVLPPEKIIMKNTSVSCLSHHHVPASF